MTEQENSLDKLIARAQRRATNEDDNGDAKQRIKKWLELADTMLRDDESNES